MKTLNDFFADTFCGMHHAERKFVATLPKMARTALANHEADELLTNLADRIEPMAAQAA